MKYIMPMTMVNPTFTDYASQNYNIQELVDPATYGKYKKNAWQFFDVRLLYCLDIIVWFFNEKPIINNWSSGGRFKYSGFRPHSYPLKYSASGSMHRFGRAFDLKFSRNNVNTIYTAIKKHYDIFKYITRMEDIEATGPKKYIHIDSANKKSGAGIYIFKP